MRCDLQESVAARQKVSGIVVGMESDQICLQDTLEYLAPYREYAKYFAAWPWCV